MTFNQKLFNTLHPAKPKRESKAKKTSSPDVMAYRCEQEELIEKASPGLQKLLIFHGIMKCGATYSGEGDSGQVDGVYFLNGNDEVHPIATDDPLYIRALAMLYALIDCADYDWHNNEGGGGDIEWDLKTGEFRFDAFFWGARPREDATHLISYDKLSASFKSELDDIAKSGVNIP